MCAKSLEKVKVLESSLQESVNKKAHHEQSKEIRALQEVQQLSFFLHDVSVYSFFYPEIERARE